MRCPKQRGWQKSTLQHRDVPAILPPLFIRFPLANTDETRRTELSRRDRLLLAAAGIGLLVLLTLAALLRPDPAGHGTHQGLGLPPCTFLTLVHRPCPTCGMTTAWAHLMRGQWSAAVHANAGGTLLWLLAIVATPWLLASAIRGRWWPAAPRGRVVVCVCVAVLLVTTIDWAIRALVLW